MVDLDLADCVEFIDEQPHEQIAGFMAEADLLILPSYYDSFGIVLAEAMACGLPVVATRCGGLEELVDEGSGELVAVGDAEALAAGILAAIAKYDHYSRLGIRRRAESRWDYRRIADHIYALYGEVLAGGSRGSPSAR